MSTGQDARKGFLKAIKSTILHARKDSVSVADAGNDVSMDIARAWSECLPGKLLQVKKPLAPRTGLDLHP